MHATPRRLLYIDDDEGLCRIVKKDFERSSYLVDMAQSGIDGIAKVQATRYDAIILDHHMPGQDGLATLEQISTLEDPAAGAEAAGGGWSKGGVWGEGGREDGAGK